MIYQLSYEATHLLLVHLLLLFLDKMRSSSKPGSLMAEGNIVPPFFSFIVVVVGIEFDSGVPINYLHVD